MLLRFRDTGIVRFNRFRIEGVTTIDTGVGVTTTTVVVLSDLSLLHRRLAGVTYEGHHGGEMEREMGVCGGWAGRTKNATRVSLIDAMVVAPHFTRPPCSSSFPPLLTRVVRFVVVCCRTVATCFGRGTHRRLLSAAALLLGDDWHRKTTHRPQHKHTNNHKSTHTTSNGSRHRDNTNNCQHRSLPTLIHTQLAPQRSINSPNQQ